MRMIEQGPDPQVHGVVRWRLIDLARRLEEDFQLEVSIQTLSRELRRLGYRKLSARPRHQAQDATAQAAFKRMVRPVRKWFASAWLDLSAQTYPAFPPRRLAEMEMRASWSL